MATGKISLLGAATSLHDPGNQPHPCDSVHLVFVHSCHESQEDCRHPQVHRLPTILVGGVRASDIPEIMRKYNNNAQL